MNVQNRLCRRFVRAFLAPLGVLLLASCASVPVALDPVGPKPGVRSLDLGQGSLVVFSATEVKMIGRDTPYYVHTGYAIKTKDGKKLKWVPNHSGDMDQSAQFVLLPVGSYQVVAQSESYGQVVVPVVIAGHQTTEVHLDHSWKPDVKAGKEAELVGFPNGQLVGWRAASPAK